MKQPLQPGTHPELREPWIAARHRLHMLPQAKGWAAEWLAQPGSVAERKKTLTVLAARLGPHEHGLGFGGFSTRLGFLLMKKRWGRFTPSGRVFFLHMPPQDT